MLHNKAACKQKTTVASSPLSDITNTQIRSINSNNKQTRITKGKDSRLGYILEDEARGERVFAKMAFLQCGTSNSDANQILDAIASKQLPLHSDSSYAKFSSRYEPGTVVTAQIFKNVQYTSGMLSTQKTHNFLVAQDCIHGYIAASRLTNKKYGRTYRLRAKVGKSVTGASAVATMPNSNSKVCLFYMYTNSGTNADATAGDKVLKADAHAIATETQKAMDKCLDKNMKKTLGDISSPEIHLYASSLEITLETKKTNLNCNHGDGFSYPPKAHIKLKGEALTGGFLGVKHKKKQSEELVFSLCSEAQTYMAEILFPYERKSRAPTSKGVHTRSLIGAYVLYRIFGQDVQLSFSYASKVKSRLVNVYYYSHGFQVFIPALKDRKAGVLSADFDSPFHSPFVTTTPSLCVHHNERYSQSDILSALFSKIRVCYPYLIHRSKDKKPALSKQFLAYARKFWVSSSRDKNVFTMTWPEANHHLEASKRIYSTPAPVSCGKYGLIPVLKKESDSAMFSLFMEQYCSIGNSGASCKSGKCAQIGNPGPFPNFGGSCGLIARLVAFLMVSEDISATSADNTKQMWERGKSATFDFNYWMARLTDIRLLDQFPDSKNDAGLILKELQTNVDFLVTILTGFIFHDLEDFTEQYVKDEKVKSGIVRMRRLKQGSQFVKFSEVLQELATFGKSIATTHPNRPTVIVLIYTSIRSASESSISSEVTEYNSMASYGTEYNHQVSFVVSRTGTIFSVNSDAGLFRYDNWEEFLNIHVNGRNSNGKFIDQYQLLNDHQYSEELFPNKFMFKSDYMTEQREAIKRAIRESKSKAYYHGVKSHALFAQVYKSRKHATSLQDKYLATYKGSAFFDEKRYKWLQSRQNTYARNEQTYKKFNDILDRDFVHVSEFLLERDVPHNPKPTTADKVSLEQVRMTNIQV